MLFSKGPFCNAIGKNLYVLGRSLWSGYGDLKDRLDDGIHSTWGSLTGYAYSAASSNGPAYVTEGFMSIRMASMSTHSTACPHILLK